MNFINHAIGKWMPEHSPRVAVDSHPRLSGIMDTINSTLAHGPEVQLPQEFYQPKVRTIIEKIGVEEWFAGYQESNEYRSVGIGGLVGDIVSRMVGTVFNGPEDRADGAGLTKDQLQPEVNLNSRLKLGLSGCHDTTLAAMMASLGVFEGEPWPPYTSHVAIELFKKQRLDHQPVPAGNSFWSSIARLFGTGDMISQAPNQVRKTMNELTDHEEKQFDDYFVRMRYNNRPLTIPGCRTPGNHLDGDQSFCTLVSVISSC